MATMNTMNAAASTNATTPAPACVPCADCARNIEAPACVEAAGRLALAASSADAEYWFNRALELAAYLPDDEREEYEDCIAVLAAPWELPTDKPALFVPMQLIGAREEWDRRSGWYALSFGGKRLFQRSGYPHLRAARTAAAEALAALAATVSL